ncbi:DR2241 family protein [Halovivax gelatinilyticus]|uniref:DR2241 family protein n=1 Tax=Halovivax gelatinilyticus TaxID=2961597 RepID=UPI0020CA6304|nr:DR2241 family protein [Halovivax gelatinilyticus]
MSEATEIVDSFLEAVDDGISTNGFVVERSNRRIRLSTPEMEPIELEEGALRDRLESAIRADDPPTDDPVGCHVTDWYHWTHRVNRATDRAFCRWCERAPIPFGDDEAVTGSDLTDAEPIEPLTERYAALVEGIDREWGQLLVTARLDSDGNRRYDVRHVDDRDIDSDDLTACEDQRVARDIATADDRGRYRPLSTAPTLTGGWAFSSLSGRALVRTVDTFYPATIANWDRERRGELDVDHWLETAERQSGIYDVVDELPREAVEWMAEACCVDSQCLRRREWEYSANDPLSVDGGDGPFPCREPCSLVISAARQWAIAESESENRVTLELTTTELNQLSAVIDAVAEGRIDEIREADVADGANRYRARYLRAKRFDEEGQLSIVGESDDSTEQE